VKHLVIRSNPATREYFCTTCGRTSDAISAADAQERLEQYECKIPSVEVSRAEPGTKTMRLNRKSYRRLE
jgi:DNA-directed RNA polymerase subunit RPC12/RpoP